MMAHAQEPQDEKRRMQKRLAFLRIIVLLILGGAIIWILNIQGIVPGPWSSIFSAVFTVIGVIVALLPWHQPSPARISRGPLSLPLFQPRMPNVPLEETNLGVNRRKGALIVKVRKKLVGSTVYLCHGFDNPVSSADVASNVVVRMVGHSPTFVAIFTALEPGNYSVSVHSTEQRTNVTIKAGQVAEIDWRYWSGKL